MTHVTELRVALTVDDFDAALALYRDALGLDEVADWTSENGRVVVLSAGRATLELFDEAQAAYVDSLEAGRRVSGTVRLAFEVPDSAEVASRLVAAGAEEVAAPVDTPWGDRNARVRAQDGMQLTLFSPQQATEHRSLAWERHIGMTTITGFSHLAVNTADLQRFRRFYEGLLGIPMGVTLRMDHPPYLRHATFHLDGPVVIHVFEVPGYDPASDGIGTEIGQRGRIDHFGFQVADEEALGAIADRLRAAGATDGEIRPLGPVLSVHVTDPDGLELEVNCPNLGFDIGAAAGMVEEVGASDWLDRILDSDSAALAAHR